jgi:hypothetical protein
VPHLDPDPLLVARRALVAHRERSLRSSEGWAALACALILACVLVYDEGFTPLAAFLLGVSSAGLFASGIDALRYLRLARILSRIRHKEPSP